MVPIQCIGTYNSIALISTYNSIALISTYNSIALIHRYDSSDEFVFHRVENILGKGENAGQHNFFQKFIHVGS